MIGLIEDLLARQDPSKPHTLLTRLLICFCIGFAYIVLYGFYGLVAAVAVYLLGVELMGLSLQWMFYAFFIGIFLGAWRTIIAIRDYWLNAGHGI